MYTPYLYFLLHCANYVIIPYFTQLIMLYKYTLHFASTYTLGIHGFGFCHAAKDAFFLILRNCLRVAILTTLSNLAMFIAKIMITGIVGGSVFFILHHYYQDDLNGLIAPTVFSMFLG